MNVRVLIDTIVRQTTVLIADLATAGGIRAPLSRVANQVFLNLVQELEAQGLGRKVVADMFGLALRSYQVKVRRLEASATESEQSLWEAIFDFIHASGEVTRREVLDRFLYDDEPSVRGILRDQVESRLIYTSGRGIDAVYRAARDDERRGGLASPEGETANALIWVTVYREGPVTAQEVAAGLGLPVDTVETGLTALVEDGRVQLADPEERTYQSRSVLIPVDEAVGWEAALFDHFQALVTAISAKLRSGKHASKHKHLIGGATYSFDVWPGHPHEGQVTSLLSETREKASDLMRQVTAWNDSATSPEGGCRKVTFYFGQNVVGDAVDPTEDEGA